MFYILKNLMYKKKLYKAKKLDNHFSIGTKLTINIYGNNIMQFQVQAEYT